MPEQFTFGGDFARDQLGRSQSEASSLQKIRGVIFASVIALGRRR